MNRRLPAVVLCGLLMLLVGCGHDEESAAGDLPTSPTEPRSIHYPRWQTPEPGDFHGYNQRASLLQRGRLVYQNNCAGCHGDDGRGYGPAAERLITRPRDFTSGIYKFRSTDSSSLPLESDLHRTITYGLPSVSMPAFPLMTERDKVAVIQYIKDFYPDWHEEADRREKVFVPTPLTDLHEEARIKRGRITYLAMQCGKCHGSDGAGTGATQTEYTDAWGDPQKARNFTIGRLKGGDDPEDIYRTFHTGLRSIMPAYGGPTLAAVNIETLKTQRQFTEPGEWETLEEWFDDFPATASEVFTELSDQRRQELTIRNSWDLVAYIQSLREDGSTATAVIGEENLHPKTSSEADSSTDNGEISDGS